MKQDRHLWVVAAVAVGLWFFGVQPSGAAEISQAQARQAVQHWVARSPAPLAAQIGGTVAAARTITDETGAALFHVIQLAGGGFAVTSADDALEPIIAFSESDDLIESGENPLWVLLQADLRGRRDALQAARAANGVGVASMGSGAAQQTWADLLDPAASARGLSGISDVRVAPLIQSTWGQGNFWMDPLYNFYTPDNRVCGCVATAVGQVMRYHQHPASSVSAAFTCKVDGFAMSLSTLGGEYAWADMPLKPVANATPLVQRQAIGKLLRDVGVASRAEYWESATGTSILFAYLALRDTFDYAAMAYYSENLDAALLWRMIIPNLDARRPVCLSIYGNGGHAVVADGYGDELGSRYVHVNLGWNGMDDAWYLLPQIDAASGAYTSINGLIYNIFPDAEGDIISGRVTDAGGVPVSGAQVTANKAGMPTLYATTDANGIYSFIVPSAGSYAISTMGSSLDVWVEASVTSFITPEGYYFPSQQSVGNSWGNDMTVVAGKASASFSENPTDCAPLTVYFDAGTTPLAAAAVEMLHRFSSDSNGWSGVAMTRVSSNAFIHTFDVVPDNAPFLEVCFNDGQGGNWQSLNGMNWKTTIVDCDAPVVVSGVALNPVFPLAGETVQVTYHAAGRALAAAHAVNIHYGYNGDNWTTAPGMAMTKSWDSWVFDLPIPAGATNLVMCFNDGGATWDNNNSANWVFPVQSPTPPPDNITVTNVPMNMPVLAEEGMAVVSGTMGTNLEQQLFWTNHATSASGSVAAENHDFTFTVPLSGGTNRIELAAQMTGTGTTVLQALALDSASRYAVWEDGIAAASGFGAWQFNLPASGGGVFLADAGINANCNIGANAFGLWAQGGNKAEVFLPFAGALEEGQTFSLDFENNFLEAGGQVGVALQTDDGERLWQFSFTGGEACYTQGEPAQATTLGWLDSGVHVAFTLLPNTTYEASITPFGGAPVVYSGSLPAAAPIRRLCVWNHSAGVGGNYNLYVNNPKITGGVEIDPQFVVQNITFIYWVAALEITSFTSTTAGGSGFQFALPETLPGATYAVYECPDLMQVPTQQWDVVEGTQVVADGGAISLSVTNLDRPQSHYRIGYTITP